ncbi:MAG: hypothetical protein ACE37I_01670 [Rubinisphaera brasiliensis]|uniref:hypothetical protein n=1 Tax=Rubinisphaera brasiliensis TaxID=119 RepID=UPI003918FB3D|nr:hypothetical protein [bacterium]
MKRTTRQVGTSSSDIQLGSLACYVLATVVLVAGFWRLFSVEASEIQVLLGALLVLNLSVMSAAVGLLLPISLRSQQLAHAHEQISR